MKTVNSISGGQTSAYIAAKYPADFNVFALVTVKDKNCKFPDEPIRKVVSEKIGREFIGTVEDDMIIYTILDLEQYIGKEIKWLSGPCFEDIMTRRGRGQNMVYLPNEMRRFCTTEMKIDPIKRFWLENIIEPCEMRIGFRANEQRRAEKMLKKLNENGFEVDKMIVGKRKDGKNKWEKMEWRRPVFPLIQDAVFKDEIIEYWKGKQVRFAHKNNCLGCMNANPIYIKHQFERNQNKIQWFVDQEKQSLIDYGRTWRLDGLTYQKIIDSKTQIEMFTDDDFSECDSGHCGI